MIKRISMNKLARMSASSLWTNTTHLTPIHINAQMWAGTPGLTMWNSRPQDGLTLRNLRTYERHFETRLRNHTKSSIAART
jgi:hypothetical protein